MLNSGVRKYIATPSLGLLPLLVYFILHLFENEEYEILCISLLVAVIVEVLLQWKLKSRIFIIPFIVLVSTFIISFAIWLFIHNHIIDKYTYIICCEILLIIASTFIHILKPFISARFLRNKNLTQKAFLEEFYNSVSIFQFMFIAHILIVLIYKILESNNFTFSSHTNITIYIVIPSSFILLLMLYEVIKTSTLSTKLRREEWLPIITERGEVTGRIAKAITFNMKNKFLHPVIRVALVCQEKLYLQERKADDILDPGKLDHPFEKYLLFSHEINTAAKNSIIRMMDKRLNSPLDFVLKYTFENNITKRLIFLYVVRIQDEEEIKRTDKMTGKFWSIKQMEGIFADNELSECFELEYEYIKNMVLQPQRII